MFPGKRGKNWNHLEIMAYLLVTLTHQRHTRYVFLVTRKLRLSKMSPLMRVKLSKNKNKTFQKKSMRRRVKLLEFHRKKELNHRKSFMRIMTWKNLRGQQICLLAREYHLGKMIS
jgi:hypothetical protein